MQFVRESARLTELVMRLVRESMRLAELVWRSARIQPEIGAPEQKRNEVAYSFLSSSYRTSGLVKILKKETRCPNNYSRIWLILKKHIITDIFNAARPLKFVYSLQN
jgi:hypothetical protein